MTGTAGTEGTEGAAEVALELRRSTPEDYDTLLTWVRSAEELMLFSGPSLTWPLTREQLDGLRRMPGRTDWTAVLAGDPEAPIGHLDLVLENGNAHLARVLLAPEVRGRGLARPMIRRALELAGASGAATATLNVVDTNEKALRVYRALGFSPVPAPELPPGVLRMERTLPAS